MTTADIKQALDKALLAEDKLVTLSDGIVYPTEYLSTLLVHLVKNNLEVDEFKKQVDDMLIKAIDNSTLLTDPSNQLKILPVIYGETLFSALCMEQGDGKNSPICLVLTDIEQIKNIYPI